MMHMGSAAGAEKAAARRLGLSIEDYAEKIDAGLKHCRLCRAWKLRDEFYGDRRRGDGRMAVCIACHKADSRARHVPVSPHHRKKPGPPRTIGSRRWKQENGR
jgi:hypothetical protein